MTERLPFGWSVLKEPIYALYARDVGNALGVGGAMSDLERLSSGTFHIEDAVDIRDLKGNEYRGDCEEGSSH